MKEKKHLKHFSLFTLTLASLGSMIGSGWLFGAWKAARLAGPAAVLAWPIGAVAILLLALSYAELGARYPATGGMVRYTQMSHGSFAGFMAGWANWISLVSVISIEAVSSIQYLSAWPWQWAKSLYDLPHHQLTNFGLLCSVILIVFYFFVNYWSIKLFIHSMISITLFKICVPAITCAALFYAAFHQHSFDLVHQSFMPYGLQGVFTAVSTAGVVFSFNGFQSAINLSGEAKKPGRDVPIAIFLSLAIASVLYVLLQFVFVGALSPKDLAQGWNNLLMSSPYVHLALSFELNWLVIFIYLDAIISPSGTAIAYTATTARMLLGMQKNGYLPSFLGIIHPRYHVPRLAMCFNFIVSLLFLYVFKGWGKLVAVISVATIISYVNGPVSSVAMRYWRKKLGDKIKLPIRIKGLSVISPLAFIVISFVLYWACWPLTGEVIFIMLLGLPIYFYYQYKGNFKEFKEDWISGIWLLFFLVVMALISYLGSSEFGGINLFNIIESYVLVVLIGFIFYFWGLKSSFVFMKTKNSIQSLD